MRHHDLARVDVAQVQEGLLGLDPPRDDQLGLLILPQELRVGLPGVAQDAVGTAVELLLGQPRARLQAGISLARPDVLEMLGVGRDTDQGIRRGIVDVLDALVLVQERMAVGEFADICGGFGKLGNLFEPLRLRIELGKTALVDFEHLADLGVDREHPLARLAILEDDQSRDPGRALAGHRGRRAGEPLVVEEVAQVDADLGLEPPLAGQVGGGARHMKVAERIVGSVGVAPEPVDLPLVDRVHHAVLAEDLAVQERLADRHGIAGQHAVAIDARSGDAVEPAGDVEPADHDVGRTSLGHFEGLAAIAEAVFVDFVAVAGDREKDLAVEEAGLVEGHDAVAVGNIANLVDRLELDQGDAAAGPFLDDVDAENARAGARRRVGRGRGLVRAGRLTRGSRR